MKITRKTYNVLFSCMVLSVILLLIFDNMRVYYLTRCLTTLIMASSIYVLSRGYFVKDRILMMAGIFVFSVIDVLRYFGFSFTLLQIAWLVAVLLIWLSLVVYRGYQKNMQMVYLPILIIWIYFVMISPYQNIPLWFQISFAVVIGDLLRQGLFYYYKKRSLGGLLVLISLILYGLMSVMFGVYLNLETSVAFKVILDLLFFTSIALLANVVTLDPSKRDEVIEFE